MLSVVPRSSPRGITTLTDAPVVSYAGGVDVDKGAVSDETADIRPAEFWSSARFAMLPS